MKMCIGCGRFVEEEQDGCDCGKEPSEKAKKPSGVKK